MIINVFFLIGSSSNALSKLEFTIFSASGNLSLLAKSFLSSTTQTLKPDAFASGAMALPTCPPPAINIAGSVVMPSTNIFVSSSSIILLFPKVINSFEIFEISFINFSLLIFPKISPLSLIINLLPISFFSFESTIVAEAKENSP